MLCVCTHVLQDSPGTTCWSVSSFLGIGLRLSGLGAGTFTLKAILMAQKVVHAVSTLLLQAQAPALAVLPQPNLERTWRHDMEKARLEDSLAHLAQDSGLRTGRLAVWTGAKRVHTYSPAKQSGRFHINTYLAPGLSHSGQRWA